MREVADVFGDLQRLSNISDGNDPSHFGATEHELHAAVTHHQARLAELRKQNEIAGNAQAVEQEEQRQIASVQELAVEALADAEELGPVAYAKQLCDQATLTQEQRGPVALIARDMQRAWEKEVQRRADLTPAQRETLHLEQWTIPLNQRICRCLVFGGGGCGKTRVIVNVLAPLFRRYFGPRGCVLTAFSNKAARLINGKTGHALTKIRGAQSLTMARLRVKNDQERRALAAVWAPVGALVKDEFSQQPAPIEHAIAVRAMYGRECFHGLRREDYARPETNYASIPIVFSAGDPLQFPPVPASASLLAEPDGQSREHRAAEQMFQQQDYVCELKTTMRFRSDPVLTRILQKMRTPAEDRTELQLTTDEWQALQSTDIKHGASLAGTEMWYHAAFAWSYVCMAQWLRSKYSAAHHHETLFLVPAKDYVQNVEARDMRAVRDELLKYPNMNTTGRLPGVALLHVHMAARLTVTICPRMAPVDSTGVIKSIELHVMDRVRWQQHPDVPMFVLHHMPTVLFRLDGDDTDTGLGPGVVAVKPIVTAEAFSVTINIPPATGEGCSRARSLDVRAKREQVGLTICTAATLYTLQGTTATPGLIYHWRTPRRVTNLMRWIAVYMALSRLQSLKEFRSIGITTKIRDIINGGPPPGMLTRFTHLFASKAEETERLVEEALRELDWMP